jgi:hypothetical protein
MAVASEKPMSPFRNPETFTPRPGLVHIPVIPWISAWNSQAAL